MQLQKSINVFGGDLSRRYEQRVHKLTFHGDFSYSDRGGTIGRGRCTFCDIVSFADEAQQHHSITEQLEHQTYLVNRVKRHLTYFQAYTNTFAEVQVLRSIYQQAVSQASIVRLCIGIRPDYVPDAVLDLLCEYRDLDYEVWLEPGLQTTYNRTLHRINRGHDSVCHQHITRLIRERGLRVCSHLIAGLSGKGQAEYLQAMEHVAETGVDGIKLHSLHIMRGSTVAKVWKAGRLNGIELDDYTVTTGEIIRYTPPEVIYHRTSASACHLTLLAPLWRENRWTGMVGLDKYLNKYGMQSSVFGTPWVLPENQLSIVMQVR